MLNTVRNRCQSWRERHFGRADVWEPFDLLHTFFWRLDQMCRELHFCVSTSQGCLIARNFAKGSLFKIEDPFCFEENTARTIQERRTVHKLKVEARNSLLVSAACYAANDPVHLALERLFKMDWTEGRPQNSHPWVKGEKSRNYFCKHFPNNQRPLRVMPPWPWPVWEEDRHGLIGGFSRRCMIHGLETITWTGSKELHGPAELHLQFETSHS